MLIPHTTLLSINQINGGTEVEDIVGGRATVEVVVGELIRLLSN
jgi:hypothetical protein